MRRLRTLGTALIVALVLVTFADYVSFAATGHSFLLGKLNSANKQTTLSRTTAGPVLNLHTKSGANPPLVVNGTGMVAHLNADLLDGAHASSLRTAAWRFSLPDITATNTQDFYFHGLPPGLYTASFGVTAIMSVAGTPLDCGFLYSDNANPVIVYGGIKSSASTANGSSIIDTRSKSVRLNCFDTAGTYTLATPAAQVDFVRIDTLTDKAGSLTP